MPLDLNAIRSQFPALSRDCIYLDNPAGTQVARSVLDRIKDYLVQHNANHEGAFATSRESDALVEEARLAAEEARKETHTLRLAVEKLSQEVTRLVLNGTNHPHD